MCVGPYGVCARDDDALAFCIWNTNVVTGRLRRHEELDHLMLTVSAAERERGLRLVIENVDEDEEEEEEQRL